jgi:hypothetical protein
MIQRQNVLVAWGLFLCIIIAIIIYFMCPGHQEGIKFVTTSLFVGAVIYSAYNVGASLRLQVRHNMQKASFDLLNMINTKEFVKDRAFIDERIMQHQGMTDKELYDEINNDKDLDAAVTAVTGVLEDMSIMIQAGFIDESILYKSMRSIVLRNWQGLRGWIKHTRERRKKESPLKEESTLIEFQKLATSWDMAKSLIDGHEFDPLC